jgi:pimeloyl-ACP methyl ester carboxylesterase
VTVINATLVTIHGFWSSPAIWERLNEVWRSDEELRDLNIHAFSYPSPRKPRVPFSDTRVPDYDDIAQTFATEYETVLADARDIAVVTHSQGGLILQRFLFWMVSQGRAQELVRIRSVIMLACPNGGSEYLESLRRTLGYGRHPQAGSLQVLDRHVADTQRAVLQHIVNATAVDDHQCRIPFHVYAGGSDDIVRAASAQASFPRASTIAGNHFTILDPAAQGNRTAETVKRHLLADIANNTQHNIFSEDHAEEQIAEFQEHAEPPPAPLGQFDALGDGQESGDAQDQDSSSEVDTDVTDALAERFRVEWATDIASFRKLNEQPTFEEASAAFRRGAELGMISKHGIRAELTASYVFLRIPHVDEWPAYPAIPLRVETRWLEEILIHEWTPGQSFVDTLVAIAAKLRSTPYWEGERSYNPGVAFRKFADLFLYGIELIRTGYDGVTNRIFQVVGDWVIAEWEIIDKSNHYQILFRRFAESDWISHVTEKTWVNKDHFIEAFGTAQMLIYNQIFDGRLPQGWAPPNIWPFKTTFGGSTMLF